MAEGCCALCAGASWSEYFEQVRAKIDKTGWCIQGVGGSPEDGMAFAYTIGLAAHGHPEFIICGLPAAAACEVLNGLGHRVFDGQRFEPGMRDDVVDGSYNVCLVEVDDPADHLRFAAHFASNLRALQVVWPDRDHRFPWDDGCRCPQPVFGEPALT